MLQTYAKVICHSVAPEGKEIITYELCYPRFIHAEIMTHRVLSRNAASSRAIPVAKMVAQVLRNPATFVHWGANQPGMQAAVELTGWRLSAVKALWRSASFFAAAHAWAMSKVGAHKQIANRTQESYQWMKTIVTGTEWDNFFELRAHPDAQPEFHDLALKMLAAKQASVPRRLEYGQWHLPYVDTVEPGMDSSNAKISAARCARVSYLTHDGKTPAAAADLLLFDRLAGARPLHASPLEHQATPAGKAHRSGNFVGWVQFRKQWETTVA